MEIENEYLENLEKYITIRIMQEDAETIFSLIKTERDSIFEMGIIPYYALFIQSCQEYMGETFLDEKFATKIKNIRNYIKIYGEGFGKTRKRIENVDFKQDEHFGSQLTFDFMKKWDMHYNLGTYWTQNKHIIGNTQIIAGCLSEDDIFSEETKKFMYELGKEMGSIIFSIKQGFSQVISPPTINRSHKVTSIDYYYDLNTNKEKNLFCNDSLKVLNIFFLNLACNLNFVKHILRPLFNDNNIWLFRIEYIVTYYTYRAIQRLKNYCKNNTDLRIDLEEFSDIFRMSNDLFQSKFRNCMMHYGLEKQGVISIENIEKPFYGIVETCYNGMDYYTFLNELRKMSDGMLDLLEKKFNTENISLEKL